MTQADLEQVIAKPEVIDRDKQGRPRYLGSVRGVSIFVVAALDEPDLIVTVFRRERW